MFSASKTAGPSGYNISRSVRLRSSAGGNFTRTPSVAGNKKLFTISVWLKRGALGTASDIMSATSGAGGTVAWFRFNSSDQLDYVEYNGGSFAANAQSAAVFRDPSAWYHIVLAFDSAQATAANRLKIYVNNVQQTMSGTLPTLNLDSYFDGTGAHYIGREARSAIEFFDGYMTEFNFVDGQALTPSSFGSTNATTGVWQPAKYTGTYGTNGFYLNFSDNSAATAAAIGKDYSGNGNNWTPNNISVTAGTTYDSMIDVPTPYADGSTNRGNYAVLNPLNKAGSQSTVSGGNLTFSGAMGTQDRVYGGIGMDAGKWYWEVTVSAFSPTGNGYLLVGVSRATTPSSTAYDGTALSYIGGNDATVSGYKSNRNAGTSVAYGAAWTLNDVIGVALDMDNGTLTFYKNGTSQGVAFSSITSSYPGTYFPIVWSDGTAPNATYQANFGQRPFSYTPPSGFKALNTYNLPASTVLNGGKYMAATLYTGTLLSNSITNAGSFKPDLVWVKSRSAATDHKLTDSVRGVTKALVSDSTAAETTDAQGVTAFGSAGFTVGTDTNYNNLSATYVGWQWQAGQGSTSSNTNGSITSTVSVNATAGFSIVTYTGTGANATVGHGLGVAPKMVIVKNRSGPVGAQGWAVYHAGMNASPATGYLLLNSTSAFATLSTVWNNTAPTSTVFSIGSASAVNNGNTDNYVAYCWSEIAGFSKFGSYTGNGSADGPFVYCGFRPRFLMAKRSDGVGDWLMYDSSRAPYNAVDVTLYADLASQELSAGTPRLDFVSNGFKLRNTGEANQSGAYIYAAFAEVPFSAALAR
jgi:hypothetical protein